MKDRDDTQHEEKGHLPSRTLSVEQTREVLGISRNLAYASIADGTIPSIRIGRKILVPAARLYALLGEHASTDSEDTGGGSA